MFKCRATVDSRQPQLCGTNCIMCGQNIVSSVVYIYCDRGNTAQLKLVNVTLNAVTFVFNIFKHR